MVIWYRGWGGGPGSGKSMTLSTPGQQRAGGELGGLPSGFRPYLYGEDGVAAVFVLAAADALDGHEPLGPVGGHFEVCGQAVAVGVGVDPVLDRFFEVETHRRFTALSSVLCFALSSIAFTLPSEPCPVVASATLPLVVLTWGAAS